MDCTRFIDRLDAFLEGSMDPAERRDARSHLDACRACRELAALAGKERGGEPLVDPPPDLTRAILARTSGPACESARERLCDHVDGTLAPPDDELVLAHLATCGDCLALSKVLGRVTAELPGLAEVDPGAGVVERVLDATSRRRSWADRLAAYLPKLVERPRFALECAYVLTLVFVLIFGTPTAPLAAARDAVDAIRARSARVPALRLPDGAVAGARSALEASGERAEHSARSVAKGVGRAAETALDSLAMAAGTLLGRGASEEETNTNPRSIGTDDRNRGDER